MNYSIEIKDSIKINLIFHCIPANLFYIFAS